VATYVGKGSSSKIHVRSPEEYGRTAPSLRQRYASTGIWLQEADGRGLDVRAAALARWLGPMLPEWRAVHVTAAQNRIDVRKHFIPSPLERRYQRAPDAFVIEQQMVEQDIYDYRPKNWR